MKLSDKMMEVADTMRVLSAKVNEAHAAIYKEESKQPVGPNTIAPEWIVNNLGELGVKVGDTCYFLYKADNIVYKTEENDKDFPKRMMYRPVEKREFGECCYPRGHNGGIYDHGSDWIPLIPEKKD